MTLLQDPEYSRVIISQALLDKIRRIEIRSRRLVRDNLGGEYHSVFKGRGIEFEEVRPYVAGDEIRAIDWNVTARMGEPFVKRYVEERELTVMFLVDASRSTDFGSTGRFKRDLSAELTAVLAFAATTNNDKVGLLVFTDRVEMYIPPRKGRRHVLRIIRDLLAFRPGRPGTDIKAALDTINHALKRRAILFLVTDFLDDVTSFEKTLSITNRRHDLIAIEISDPMEQHLPEVGLLALDDTEYDRLAVVDTDDQRWRDHVEQVRRHRRAALHAALNRAGIDRIDISTSRDFVPPLISFFNRRARRR